MRRLRIFIITSMLLLISAIACFAETYTSNGLTWNLYVNYNAYVTNRWNWSFENGILTCVSSGGQRNIYTRTNNVAVYEALTPDEDVCVAVRLSNDGASKYNYQFNIGTSTNQKWIAENYDGTTSSGIGVGGSHVMTSDTVYQITYIIPYSEVTAYRPNDDGASSSSQGFLQVNSNNTSVGKFVDLNDFIIYQGEYRSDAFAEETTSGYTYEIPANTPFNIPAGYAAVAKLKTTGANSYAYLESFTTRSTNLVYRDNRCYSILDNYAAYQFTLSTFSTQNGFLTAVPWRISGSPIRVGKGEYIDAEIALVGSSGKYLYIYNPYVDYGTSGGSNAGQSIMCNINADVEFVKLIQNTNRATGGNDTVSFDEDSSTFQYAAFLDENGNITNAGWTFGENTDNTQTTTPQGFTTPEYYNPIDGYDGESLNINLYNPAEVATEVKDGITNVFKAISEIFTGLPVEITRLLLAFLGILLTIGVIKAIL